MATANLRRVRARRASLALAASIAALALAALPGTAAANDLFTLDPNATSAGHVIEDAAGNAYVAWVGEGVGISPELPRFCKVSPGGGCSPITLPIPGAKTLSDSASGAIPVFGPGGAISVVGPRYPHDDVIIWTSTDGGLSFDGGVERDIYSSKTNPTDALVVGSTFMIGAYNSGVGFSTAETGGLGGGSISFANPGSGGVVSSSMALADGANPVIAYFNLSDPYQLFFYRYTGAGPLTTETSWEGPVFVANGYEPNLAGGPGGLYMVSQDYSGGNYPDAINVRRFEGATFGGPRTLAVDPSPNLFAGGAIAQSPSGSRISVAWPGTRSSDGTPVMRLFTSTDGGATFTESHVAKLGTGYGLNANAELATNDGGAGWLVFRNGAGLQMADLEPDRAGAPTAASPQLQREDEDDRQEGRPLPDHPAAAKAVRPVASEILRRRRQTQAQTDLEKAGRRHAPLHQGRLHLRRQETEGQEEEAVPLPDRPGGHAERLGPPRQGQGHRDPDEDERSREENQAEDHGNDQSLLRRPAA